MSAAHELPRFTNTDRLKQRLEPALARAAKVWEK